MFDLSLGGLIVVVMGQFSLLWWRVGRLEGLIKRYLDEVKNNKPGKEED